MRLLLDAHVSGARIGKPLATRGHDVRALDSEPEADALDDEDVLALAARDSRILVTYDISDFPPLLREWAIAGRPHAGVILVYGIGQDEFGRVIRGIARLLASRPRQDDWADVVASLSRSPS